MKVLAVTSGYINQNYKKKNVNFEAVRVDADAIEGFKKLGFGGSLSQHLAFWTVGICKLARCFGSKVKTVLKDITGVEQEGVFTNAHGLIDDVTKIKQDIYLSKEESNILKPAICRANDEVEALYYRRPEPDSFKQLNRVAETARGELIKRLKDEAEAAIFDELWDTEGTECWKLGQIIKGFMADANQEGHHVTKEDTSAYLQQLETNRKAYEEADRAVFNQIRTKWFAPKPAAEVKPAVES